MKELGTVMCSLGQNPSTQDLEAMIKEVDKDNSGAIDFIEFCHLMCKNMSDADNEEDLREAFKIFDTDESGNIDFAELKATLQDVMGGTSETLDDDEIEKMIKEADVDGALLMVIQSMRCPLKQHSHDEAAQCTYSMPTQEMAKYHTRSLSRP